MSKQFNDGEKLFQWILDRYKRLKVSESTWIRQMAREFEMQELEDFLMRSTCLMVLRRLIWNVSLYSDKYGDESTAMDRFEKDFLLGSSGFKKEERRNLTRLVFNCFQSSKKNISESLANSMKKQAQGIDQKCEIGGCKIDYDSKNQHDSFSLDHIWPRSLGGSSEKWNLRVSCRRCNQTRQNITEAADSHYEHFQVRSVPSIDKDESFWNEMKWEFRIAALLQDDLKCQMCGMPVAKMEDGVGFLPVKKDDVLHIFNVKTVCWKHILK